MDEVERNPDQPAPSTPVESPRRFSPADVLKDTEIEARRDRAEPQPVRIDLSSTGSIETQQARGSPRTEPVRFHELGLIEAQRDRAAPRALGIDLRPSEAIEAQRDRPAPRPAPTPLVDLGSFEAFKARGTPSQNGHDLTPPDRVEATRDHGNSASQPVDLTPPGEIEVRRDHPVRTDVPPLPTTPGQVEVHTGDIRRRIRVVTTGVFDLIHLGHVHMLQEAKKLGDELIVIIARDETVRKMKHNPLNPEEIRRQVVEFLKPVDRAVLGKHGDIYRIIQELRPDVIALGYDQAFQEDEVKQRCRDVGVDVKVVRLPEFDHDLDSTRKIIERIQERAARNELYPREA